MNIVRICVSCTKINAGISDVDIFYQAVAARLQEQCSKLEWSVGPSPCLKVCPIGKITMTITSPSLNLKDRLTVSRKATVDSVTEEALSLLKLKGKKID